MIDSKVPKPPVETSLSSGCLRSLGTFERFRVVLHDLHFHHNVAIVGSFQRAGQSSSGSIPNLVFHALTHAIQTHPALSVQVRAKDGPNPYFERVAAFDLQRMVCFKSLPVDKNNQPTVFDDFLSEEHSKGFEDDTLPLWRVTVFEDDQVTDASSSDFSIAFVWHHVIGDGRSGLAVFATLMETFQSLPAATDSPTQWLIQPPEKSLLPALEEILPLRFRAVTRMSNWISQNWPAWLSKSPRKGQKWAGKEFTRGEGPVLTKIKHIIIPATSVSRLVAACRAEKTTMTPLLLALTVRLLFQRFQSADNMRSAAAISVRRFFPKKFQIDDSVMGLWVNAFTTELTRQDTNDLIWALARRYTRQIDYEISKGEWDLDIGHLKDIPDFKASMLALLGSPRANSFGLTNLGVFDQPGAVKEAEDQRTGDRNEWDLSSMLFSQSCHVNSGAVQVCIVTPRGLDMAIALSWQDGVMAEQDVDFLAAGLKSELMAIGRDKK